MAMYKNKPISQIADITSILQRTQTNITGDEVLATNNEDYGN